ncbi:MAG: phosphate acyltransferase PlsX [Candidatus Marinimicrobia bacterium]|nr:phosphate acyltransferase PlsX [Candidatus Neomarinimicrobiota bacterium]
MKLALDAMGGDLAPRAIVRGVLWILAETADDVKFILVGQPEAIEAELNGRKSSRISIHPATQIVNMHESASRVIKTKPDSSIVQGIKLVKDKKADAFISAGNTGAVMSTSLLSFGRIPGVKRPALGAYIPTLTGGKIICDVGANPDVKPFHMLQFAIMASHYLIHVEKIKNPPIGLINIGTESNKGSDLYQKTYALLDQELDNFVGNVEGRHLLDCEARVLVCDGFVGNIVLKFAEGWLKTFTDEIKNRIGNRKRYLLGALLLKPVFSSIKKHFDYEEYGGTPLLGVNGLSIICHGSSSEKAIKNSIMVAISCVEKNLINDTKVSLAEHLGV